MEYVKLGGAGLRVSRIGLGMASYGDPAWRAWVLDDVAAEPIVRRAAEAGVTYFDTSNIYSRGASEEVTGRLLRRIFSRREEYVLATKVFMPVGDGPNDSGLSRGHIFDSVDASLRRLGVDHIDLYQIHRWDEGTPIEETMQALDDLVRAGKVRYLGASSMWAWQFAKAQHTAHLHGFTRFVSMQNHYNLLFREEEREMLPLLLDQGVACLPWSPLAQGRLARAGTSGNQAASTRASSDKIVDAAAADNESVLTRLRAVARRLELPPARVALAWLLHQPAVTAPIVGATAAAHVDVAVAAVSTELTDDDLADLADPYPLRRPW